MSVFEILLLGLVLSLDAFCVSFIYGTNSIGKNNSVSFKIAAGTGFFQFLMPLIGAGLTTAVYSYIQNYTGLLAGVIFVFLGLKFIFEKTDYEGNSFKIKGTEDTLSLDTILLISLATSIDALAAGSSMKLLKTHMYFASLIIGIITFIDSFIGFKLGHVLKKYTTDIFSKLGGIILIFFGVKTIFL